MAPCPTGPAPATIASFSRNRRSNASIPARASSSGGKTRIGKLRSITAIGPCATSAVLKARSEEHTSELQSLMRISYAVFCLKKKKKHTDQYKTHVEKTDIHKHKR